MFAQSHQRCRNVAALINESIIGVKSKLVSSDTEIGVNGSPNEVLVTTTGIACRTMRGNYFASVISYDPPASATEFLVRARFTGGLMENNHHKARIYTILQLGRSEKVAAHIAELFFHSIGKKGIPKPVEELAFKFRKVFLCVCVWMVRFSWIQICSDRRQKTPSRMGGCLHMSKV